MRFVLDAHVPTTIMRALLDRGHDTVRAAIALPDAGDDVILRFAVAEQRIIITWDSDYGELIFHLDEPPPPAVIYIRLEAKDFPEVLPRLMPLLVYDELKGHMTIIDPGATRRRPFATKSINNG